MHTWNFKMFTKKQTSLHHFHNFQLVIPHSGECLKGLQENSKLFSVCVSAKCNFLVNIPLAESILKTGRMRSHTLCENKRSSQSRACSNIWSWIKAFSASVAPFTWERWWWARRECVKGWEMAGLRGFTKLEKWNEEFMSVQNVRILLKPKWTFRFSRERLTLASEDPLGLIDWFSWFNEFPQAKSLSLQLQHPLGMEIARRRRRPQFKGNNQLECDVIWRLWVRLPTRVHVWATRGHFTIVQ